jgi:hypothetical protein
MAQGKKKKRKYTRRVPLVTEPNCEAKSREDCFRLDDCPVHGRQQRASLALNQDRESTAAIVGKLWKIHQGVEANDVTLADALMQAFELGSRL